VPHVVDPRSVANAMRVVDEVAPEMRSAYRVLDLLEAFMAANSFEPTTPGTTITRLFMVQQIADDEWPNSIESRQRIIEQYAINPWMLDEARIRLDCLRLRKGLLRLKGRIGLKFEKPLYPFSTHHRVVTSRPAKKDGRTHLLWRTLYYLCTATGNRMKHVRISIRSLECLSDALHIKWGPRKYLTTPPTAAMVYPFAWSFPPPPEIAGLLKALGRPPCMSTGRNVAASCLSWLQTLKTGLTRKEKGGAGLSSGCPRVTMSNFLAQKVRSGELHEVDFRNLLDHSYESSRVYYARATEARDDPIDESSSDEDV